MATLSVTPNPNVTYALAYEDEHILVVAKPPRVPTQPGEGHATDTLLNALFATHAQRLQALGKARDFGLLHRLDKDASGLLVIALSKPSYDGLREAFGRHEVRKYYWVLTSRAPAKPVGVIRRPIVEEIKGGYKRARVAASGKPAVTAYRVVAQSPRGALLECRTVTGRLHQIRVHLASIGCGVLGDGEYAPKSVGAASPRLALHAHRIVLTHPITGQRIDVQTKWPRDLGPILRRLGLPRPGDAPESSRQNGDQPPDDQVPELEAAIGESESPADKHGQSLIDDLPSDSSDAVPEA